MTVTEPSPATAAPPPRDAHDGPGRLSRRLLIHPLDWDSAVFGRKMGIVAASSSAADARSPSPIDDPMAAVTSQLTAVLAQAHHERYAHLTFRIDPEDWPTIRIAEQAGMHLVSIDVDLSTSPTSFRYAGRAHSVRIRPYEPSDAQSLLALAATSLRVPRFSGDPFFTAGAVSDYHRAWISSLCVDDTNVVLVGELDRAVVGFVAGSTTSRQDGRIVLIATDPGHRRTGIGRALLEAAVRRFAEMPARHVRMRVHATNYAALRLCQQAGFLVDRTEVTYSMAFSAREAAEPPAGP